MRCASTLFVAIVFVHNAGCLDATQAPAGADGSDGGGTDAVITTLPVTSNSPTTAGTDDDATGGSSGPSSATGDTSGDSESTAGASTGDSSSGGGSSTGDPCGNGTIDVGEDCDDTDLAGQSCTGLDAGFTGGTLACADSCAFDESGCSNAPFPILGELVITEIMQNPGVLDDADGEWFEIHNPGASALQLESCAVEGTAGLDDGFVIDAAIVVAAGAYVTVSQDSAGGPGFAEDFQWPGNAFGLTNTTDRVAIVCEGALIDEVTYDDGATFPNPQNGSSMTLNPTMLTAGANNDGSNWCEGSSFYNGTDQGTPGAANDPCV